jgi:hypothetical protein
MLTLMVGLMVVELWERHTEFPQRALLGSRALATTTKKANSFVVKV